MNYRSESREVLSRQRNFWVTDNSLLPFFLEASLSGLPRIPSH